MIGEEEKPIEPPADARRPRGSLPRMRLSQQSLLGPVLRLRRRAGGRQGEAAGPPVKLITSFEDRNPFDGGTVVAEHATDGTKALRIDRGYAAMDAPQNWTGYDYLKADVYHRRQRPAGTVRRDPRQADRTATGPGSTTRPSSRRARAP